MIVRDANGSDAEALLRMGQEFAHAAKLPAVDGDSLMLTLQNLPILKVAENGAVCGVAGAMVYPHFWNAHELVAQELFWWVDPQARGSRAAVMLLQAMEDAAKAAGAKRMIMACLDSLEGEHVAALYTRKGYVPQERSFHKEF